MFRRIILSLYLIGCPMFAFSGLEHRELYDKYAAEIDKKLEAEFIKQKLCENTCKIYGNTFWTFAPRKNEFAASFLFHKTNK